jgi:hypothetical protein
MAVQPKIVPGLYISQTQICGLKTLKMSLKMVLFVTGLFFVGFVGKTTGWTVFGRLGML